MLYTLALFPSISEGPVRHGQESGAAGFSSDMRHSFSAEDNIERKYIETKSVLSVRPCNTQEIGELNRFKSTGLADYSTVQVFEGLEDGKGTSGYFHKKTQVDDSYSPGTTHRPGQHDDISTMTMNVNESSGDPESDMSVLAAPFFDISLMRNSPCALKPESKPGNVKAAPSFTSEEDLDEASVIKKSPAVNDPLSVPVIEMLPVKQFAVKSLEKCKESEVKLKPATSKRHVVPFNTYSSMDKCQEESKDPLSVPVNDVHPVDHGVIEQDSFQRKYIALCRKTRNRKKHVKLFSVFLRLLIISAQIRVSIGSCRVCRDDGCGKAHTIYGWNNTLLYDRHDSMTPLSYCSETSAPSHCKRCDMCYDDIKVIIVCFDCREAAGTLDVEGDGVRFQNIIEVDCPPLKAVTSTTVYPTQPNVTKDPEWNSTGTWIFVGIFVIVGICACTVIYCWKKRRCI
ncbi:hypothetical protein UPYG_G00147080 [Umbra pygmaea]|uniref:Uncharacterized protein n=1 Tax=Umbra pygmaea TaxID=75934 RepID=A0ABD0X0U5_UMBPY